MGNISFEREKPNPADMSIKAKLLETLLILKRIKWTASELAWASEGKANKVLKYLFELGKNGTQFTDSEKRLIADLLVDVFKIIQINIESTSIRYRTRLENFVLVKRSALQFLVEDWGQFPAKDSTLVEELKKKNIKESINILDDIISECKDWYDSSDGFTDPETDIPTAHTWWYTDSESTDSECD